MTTQEQSETWQDIKEIWEKSSQGKTINFEFSKLIDELKNNTSQWEKDSIKSDVARISTSWEKYKGNVSQWEKDSISKGLLKLSKLIKKILKKLNRKTSEKS